MGKWNKLEKNKEEKESQNLERLKKKSRKLKKRKEKQNSRVAEKIRNKVNGIVFRWEMNRLRRIGNERWKEKNIINFKSQEWNS